MLREPMGLASSRVRLLTVVLDHQIIRKLATASYYIIEEGSIDFLVHHFWLKWYCKYFTFRPMNSLQTGKCTPVLVSKICTNPLN